MINRLFKINKQASGSLGKNSKSNAKIICARMDIPVFLLKKVNGIMKMV